MHGGLIDDGGMRLIENGNLTGARKALDAHKHLTGMAWAYAELMAWLAGRRDVEFRGANDRSKSARFGNWMDSYR